MDERTTGEVIENKINEANQAISKDYANLINTLDEIRKIMPANEIYLLDEKLHEFDRLFQSTVGILRQHLRGYVTQNIDEIIRQDTLVEEILNQEIAEAQRLMGIYPNNDNQIFSIAR